jgi:type II secretory ATPase GspE/PulE/Tfp pilus assembly ATPase PilB-like protein
MNFGRTKPPEPAPETTEHTTPNTMSGILSRSGPISIIELVETCIEEAYAARASDIHITPPFTFTFIMLSCT